MRRLLMTLTFTVLVGMTAGALAASGQANGPKETLIRITAGDKVIFAALNESKTAQDFIATLPKTLSMQKLHEREFYTVLPTALSKDGTTQETYELGDVAFWTKGNYFGLLYSYDRPQLSAPIIVIGKVTSDLAVFNTLNRAVDMRFEVEK